VADSHSSDAGEGLALGLAAGAGQMKTAGAAENRARLSDGFYEEIRPRLYRRIARELRGAGRVLDLGCGACELARFLVSRYGKEVTGVDVTDGGFPDPEQMEDRLRRRLRCIKADARRLEFLEDEVADAAVATWALHEMGRPREILEEARRVLRVGGELLIVDFPRDSLAQRLWNEEYYAPEEVSGILERAGYEHISASLIERGQVIWAKGFRPVSEG
jgi:ubiquinone/menaquinone biosynthesis C-methylase UbiE